MKKMKKLVALCFALSSLTAVVSFASELDATTFTEAPQGIVIRVEEATGKETVFVNDQLKASDISNKEITDNFLSSLSEEEKIAEMKKIVNGQEDGSSELDQETSTEAWYWNYYTPTYGYNTPYLNNPYCNHNFTYYPYGSYYTGYNYNYGYSYQAYGYNYHWYWR